MISARKPPLICGVGDYTVKLTEELRQQGVEVKHIGLETEPWIRRLHGLYLLRKIIPELLKNRFDLVHLQYEAFGYGQSYVLPIVLSLCSPRLVVTFHEVFHKNVFQKWRDRFLARSALALNTNDEGRVRDLQSLIRNSRIKIYNWGVGSNLPIPVPAQKLIQHQLGFFGFLNGVKNGRLLVEILRQLKQRIPDLQLVMIGKISKDSPDYLQMHSLAEKYNLLQSIEWTGALSGEEAARKIQSCELMLLPFTDGASPRRGSLQACLALGKAVLTSSPKNPEPLLDGLAFQPDDSPDTWTEAALQLLQDSDQRLKLEQKAVRIAENFQWKTIADQHLSLFFNI